MAFTWSLVTGVPFNTGGVAWVGGKFLALEYAGQDIATSPDGEAWTNHPSQLVDAGNWAENNCIHAGKLAAVSWGSSGRGGTLVGDVDAWTESTINHTASNWNAIASNGTTLVAVRDLSFQCAYSTDNGATWTLTPIGSAGSSDSWGAVVWNGSIFCMVEKTSNMASATSADGITWVYHFNVLANNQPVSLVWNGHRFIALGSNGFGSTSVDGVTWDIGFTITGDVSTGWFSLTAFGRTLIAARDNSSQIAISEDDGATWSVIDTGLGTAIYWYGGASNQDDRVIFGSDSAVLLGVSDTSIVIPPTPFWTGFVNCEET